MGYFPVRYDPRVVNYDCRGFIRLATGRWKIFFDKKRESSEERRHRELFVMGWIKVHDGQCGQTWLNFTTLAIF